MPRSDQEAADPDPGGCLTLIAGGICITFGAETFADKWFLCVLIIGLGVLLALGGLMSFAEYWDKE